MNKDQLDKAVELEAKIKELNRFLDVAYRSLSDHDIGLNGDLSIYLSIGKKITAIANRYFGCGNHERSIEIPEGMFQCFSNLVFNEKERLKEELEEL